MKRNVMMRLASFLLVAVLISTSAISGTYAKYNMNSNNAVVIFFILLNAIFASSLIYVAKIV